MSGPLVALADALQSDGGLLADAVDADAAVRCDTDARHGALAAAGSRARGREAEYALLVEAIREGYLLHYGTAAGPRVLRTEDADLALLAGDRLYALGLERLAAIGDLEAVAALADLISAGAQVNAEGRPQDADLLWEEGAAAVGGGPAPPR